MAVPHVVNPSLLPAQFPTHLHDAAFWEALGRAVATLGFLEETLGKAIFALTATREYSPEEIDDAFAKWLPTLERALYDPWRSGGQLRGGTSPPRRSDHLEP